MLFDDAQSYTAFKSSCRLSQSATSPTQEYSLVSSAKLTSLDADTSMSISEIIFKNIRGPKTVPCGTPLNTFIQVHTRFRQQVETYFPILSNILRYDECSLI